MPNLDLRVCGAAIAMLLFVFEGAGNCAIQTDLSDLQSLVERAVRLPPSRFPQLPMHVRRELERRGCTIPQVLRAKEPGNVIKGSFVSPAQIDYAVLCSVNRMTRVLVFQGGSDKLVLEAGRRVADVDILWSINGGEIGYSRAISAVGRDYIMQHYKAYGGLKPPPIDHQGINDAFQDKASTVLYFYRGKWLELAGAD